VQEQEEPGLAGRAGQLGDDALGGDVVGMLEIDGTVSSPVFSNNVPSPFTARYTTSLSRPQDSTVSGSSASVSETINRVTQATRTAR
jgi:hypothetical protein